MQLRKRALALIATTALTVGLVAVAEAPAFAATCSASVTYGTSGTTASATEYNGSTPGTACALVQVKLVADVGGGVSVTYLGPQSSASSYKSVYSIGTAWYGRAKPSTTWSEQRWNTYSGQVKSFSG